MPRPTVGYGTVRLAALSFVGNEESFSRQECRKIVVRPTGTFGSRLGQQEVMLMDCILYDDGHYIRRQVGTT